MIEYILLVILIVLPLFVMKYFLYVNKTTAYFLYIELKIYRCTEAKRGKNTASEQANLENKPYGFPFYLWPLKTQNILKKNNWNTWLTRELNWMKYEN